MGGKILDYEANLVSRKIFSVEDAAMEAQLTPEIFERKMREFTAHGKS